MKLEHEIENIFSLMRQENKKYSTLVDGMKIEVLPNVFSPKYYNDTQWYAQKIKPLTKGKTFAEVGCGTGAVSLVQYNNGAKILWTTDINEDALINADINFRKYGLVAPHDTIISKMDVFDKNALPKVDIMIWAHPWNNCDDERSTLLKAGFDKNYKGLEKYISQGNNLADTVLLELRIMNTLKKYLI